MASYSTLTSDDIHHLLDDEVSALCNPWNGIIKFPVFVVIDMKSFSPSVFHSEPQDVDICSYLGASKYPTERLYFPPSKYPPPSADGGMSLEEGVFFRSWINLKQDLEIAALESRHLIVSNGGGKDYRKLVCGCLHRSARKSKAMPVSAEQSY